MQINLTPAQTAPLVELIQSAQSLLTEHMQPLGPSKADTIKALDELLLGSRADRALAAAEHDKLNAERYQFLRNDPPVELAVRKHPGETARGCYLDGPTLDIVIDAAIAATKEKQT